MKRLVAGCLSMLLLASVQLGGAQEADSGTGAPGVPLDILKSPEKTSEQPATRTQPRARATTSRSAATPSARRAATTRRAAATTTRTQATVRTQAARPAATASSASATGRPALPAAAAQASNQAGPVATPVATPAARRSATTARQARGAQPPAAAKSSSAAQPTADQQATPKKATPKQAAAAQPAADLPVPEFTATLNRLRLNRAKVYQKRAEIQPGEGSEEELLTANSPENELWFPAMSLEFRLTAPKDWAIVKVDEARLTQAMDQDGTALVQPDGSAAGGMQSLDPYIEIKPDFSLVQVRSGVPPIGVKRFKDMYVRFNVTMGYRQTLTIEDLHGKVGAHLLTGAGVQDLALDLNKADKESIVLAGLGNVSRLGGVHFFNEAGEEIHPLSVEVLSPEGPSPVTKQPYRQWTYSFTELPDRVDMHLDYYPTTRAKAKTFRIPDLPLP